MEEDLDLAGGASRGLMVATLTGSHAYGTSIPTSDTDIRGVFVASLPLRLMLPAQVETFKGQGDSLFFEASRFGGLVLSQNPAALEVLWGDPECRLFSCDAWEALAAMRERLLTRKAGYSYGGFAEREMNKVQRLLEESLAGRVLTPQESLRVRKTGLHILRLLRMAHEVLRGEGVQVRRPDADELLAIRHGERPITDVMREIDGLFLDLPRARLASPLPAENQHAAEVRDIVASMSMSAWNRLSAPELCPLLADCFEAPKARDMSP